MKAVDEGLVKIIAPFLTFMLGIVSALLLRRIEGKKKTFMESLDKVNELLIIWYAQLNEIYSEIKMSPDSFKSATHMLYINNRLVLPNLIHHIEILTKYKKASLIVTQAREFLSLVTNYSESFNGPLHCRDVFSVKFSDVPREERLRQLLHKLDLISQNVAVEVARLKG